MQRTPRDLYLDLLIQVLTNMIYKDNSMYPLGRFRREVRLTGQDWPMFAHTMVGVRRLENLRELAQAVIDENIPGDFIETGVWRGGCCILLRGILAANGSTDRKVYAADSFAGLPPPDPLAYPADAGFDLSQYKQLAVPLDKVKENFASYGLLDEQVVFVEGASNLVANEQDRSRLQELLQALEQKQRLVELLGAYLDAKQEAVRVVIGLDEAQPSMRNLVLIGTPARVGGEVMGSLAVLGPPRIDYQHTITAVSYIARLFDKILNENE